jgi:hypothetical protein
LRHGGGWPLYTKALLLAVVDDDFLSNGENREYNMIRYTHKYVIRFELMWPALEVLGAGLLIVDGSAIQSFVKIKKRETKSI